MTEAKHTPGPWHVEDPLGCGLGDHLWIVQEGKTPQVYDWRNLAVVCSDDPDDCENGQPITVAERDANARLIAAAPDMLAAMLGVMDILGRAESNASGNPEWGYVSPRIAAVRAAIAKATPSARITSDKDRENPVEGAHPYGDGLIGRILELEDQVKAAREIIAQIEPDFRHPPTTGD